MKFKLEIAAEGENFSDLEQAVEQVATKIREDYWSGSDSNDTGRYHFNILELDDDFYEPVKMHRLAEYDEGDKFIVAKEEIFYPIPVGSNNFAQGVLTIVLAANMRNEYAAYMGGIGNPENPSHFLDYIWIAAHGSKLTFKEASKYFPWIAAKYYRR